MKITVCENTAVAAKMVADSGRCEVAAISSRSCEELLLSALEYAMQLCENRYKVMQQRREKKYTGSDVYVIIDEHLRYRAYKYAVLYLSCCRFVCAIIFSSFNDWWYNIFL